ncbi:MAG: hypothetical protein ACK5QT_10890 [Oligoflexia bacterium]
MISRNKVLRVFYFIAALFVGTQSPLAQGSDLSEFAEGLFSVEVVFEPGVFHFRSRPTLARVIASMLEREGVSALVPRTRVNVDMEGGVYAVLMLETESSLLQLKSIFTEAGYPPSKVEPVIR